MQVDTLVNSHHTLTDWPQSEPSLVRLHEAALPVVAGPPRLLQSYKWPLRFVLTAALGAIGGLVAAIVLNPAPVVSSSPLQEVYEVPAATPRAAAIPIGTTTVLVPVPPPHAASALPREEITRLKSRNKRLEALVQVLRQRQAPGSARN